MVMGNKEKVLPGPCGKRQAMYVNTDGIDVTLFGGELCASN